MISTFYRLNAGSESCFYIDTTRQLTPTELDKLRWIIAETQEPDKTMQYSCIPRETSVEIGPRLSVETPFSSNAVAICRNIGLGVVRRIERSERYRITEAMPWVRITNRHMDLMTQEVYAQPLNHDSFHSLVVPEEVQTIPVIQPDGEDVLREINKEFGLGMDEADIAYYIALFRARGMDPTDVELMQIGNCNSEHCRHGFFRGTMVLDDVEMPETLLNIIRSPLLKLGSNHNSIRAFNDNAGVLRGNNILWFRLQDPGKPSEFQLTWTLVHVTHTAETHNHPTMVAPFPGAQTGTGGRIRDNAAVGRGGLIVAGFAGYCVGNLFLPEYVIPGQTVGYPGENLTCAPAWKILIDGSNGCSSYGNEFGEPVIGGFTRNFGQIVDGDRREFLKPILYSAGQGRIPDIQAEKREPEKGMFVIRIGGPAYRIGVGGGSASSIADGSNTSELDLKSVQRGNAEMGNRVNRVIRDCVELGERNPIESIHDQGAGGPSNVLTELVTPAGGRINIRMITLGDQTMSVREMWVAEFQEGYGVLVRPENLALFQALCARERVNCEVVGAVTGDGKITVIDSEHELTPVSLDLKKILEDLPRKTFKFKRPKRLLEPLKLPADLLIGQALEAVFRLSSVCSKGFLTRKVDRSVTGLIARQQCCGRAQIPVADCGVTADSYFGVTGAATAIGEQPIKLMLDSAAGVRMALGEMMFNLLSARITARADIMCRVNCMWAAKLDGEGALLYDAYVALRDSMIALGIAADGGKDSLSMSVKVNGAHVKSPPQIVILGTAPVPDIQKVVTPDFKSAGNCIGFVDLGRGKNRMGGSALAQVFGQVGNESPDVDDLKVLGKVFDVFTELIGLERILAIHDRSDGGLITTISEMCMAGLRGARITIPDGDSIAQLFSEELGVVFEFAADHFDAIKAAFAAYGLEEYFQVIGHTTDDDILSIDDGQHEVYSNDIKTLRLWWEATSDELEKLQVNPEVLPSQIASHTDYPKNHTYTLTFTPKRTPSELMGSRHNPWVAILREEGTNGDREMAAVCYAAGLEPHDVNMEDLLQGRVTLDVFQGLIFPGGFSYMDVFESAKGWAATILLNDKLREMFDRFYERPDTFSLGVCNGCQLMALLGWVPMKGLAGVSQPRFVHNLSGRFESRWSQIKIMDSPAVLLRGMEGSSFGVWVAHGEGRLLVPDHKVTEQIIKNQLVPIVYASPYGERAMLYPHNPNGSPGAEAALCSPNGRHLAMMPHPERCFRTWQWPWMPEDWKENFGATPWLTMFQNARIWCLGHKR